MRLQERWKVNEETIKGDVLTDGVKRCTPSMVERAYKMSYEILMKKV
jgi:hypothetical protein